MACNTITRTRDSPGMRHHRDSWFENRFISAIVVAACVPVLLALHARLSTPADAAYDYSRAATNREVVAQPPKPIKFTTMAALGDSIIASGDTWYLQMTRMTRSRLTNVLDAGQPGARTDEIMVHLPEVLALKPGVVLIAGGTNDVGQHRPRSQTIANLRTMAQEVAASGAQPVLITAPPSNIYPAEVQALNGMIIALADQIHVPVLTPFKSVSNDSYHYLPGMSRDGIHPTDDAHAKIAVSATNQILEQIPSLLH